MDLESVESVAIIGSALRLPGASTVEQFWGNLAGGVESIESFSEPELLANGIDPSALPDGFVNACGFVHDIEYFDDRLFDYNSRDADITDPQHRLFLQICWEALERAGIDPSYASRLIGVFAGCGANLYFQNLYEASELADYFGSMGLTIATEKDHLGTRVAYKLDLHGPALSINTSCSTSLVAVHVGCQGLLSYQCDLALAGGASLLLPSTCGYTYVEGGILSPDGHCRAFDRHANGCVPGSGAAVVVLKRLAEAIADGDPIEAVIRGSAVNNDGNRKIGYTAPSVDGQAAVIANALAVAGVSADTIGYVEAHGTGTALGDPIEVEALTRAFRLTTNRRGYCALGSVKTNIGHTDTAAGVAGLIKAALAVRHGRIPPSLHFEQANPAIDFAGSPFFVNTELRCWDSTGGPRRAGVSSLGIGGTNAHVIVEGPPEGEASGPSRPVQLLVWSARSEAALQEMTQKLAAHLRTAPQQPLADIAWTLQTGRRAFEWRGMLACRTAAEAAERLKECAYQANLCRGAAPAVVFLFPGGGAQHAGMGRELYAHETAFRRAMDECATVLEQRLGRDVRELLYRRTDAPLHDPAVALPALFATEYALAKLWMDWGVQPTALLGHSLGEYVAACVAGVMSLPDALDLVIWRGQLLAQAPPGAMASVELTATEVEGMGLEGISLAALNGPTSNVIAGSEQAIRNAVAILADLSVYVRILHIGVAAHSPLLEPVLPEFRLRVRDVRLHAPKIPLISNVTGDWLRAEEAQAVEYWVRQLREPVQFQRGLQTVLSQRGRLLLEVGPGQSLGTLARQQVPSETAVLGSLPHPQDSTGEQLQMLRTLGQLWVRGQAIDWEGFRGAERRRRVVLPTYPFERRRHWIERKPALRPVERSRFDDWFYLPTWKRVPAARPTSTEAGSWLVLADTTGLAAALATRLRARLGRVVVVEAGGTLCTEGAVWQMRPDIAEDYTSVVAAAGVAKLIGIVHLWGVTGQSGRSEPPGTTETLGFYSLMYLVQALAEARLNQTVRLAVGTNDVQQVLGDEDVCPEKALVIGACRVIAQEHRQLEVKCIDLARGPVEVLAAALEAELLSQDHARIVAYRAGQRWVEHFERLALEEKMPAGRLREGGVYLITGGLGAIGLEIGKWLARQARARLVLVGRTALEGEDERSRRRAQQVREMEEAGGEVLVLSADVTDVAQMMAAVTAAVGRFGRIDGVVHCAGVAGGGMLQLKTPAMAARVLAPKVTGTRALEEALCGRTLDWLVLCSSLGSILGGVAQADYCAANSFLDSYAAWWRQHRGGTAIAINWDTWREIGMAVETEVPAALEHYKQENLRLAMRPNEGVRAFERVLASGLPQVAVATHDLHYRLATSEGTVAVSEGPPQLTLGPSAPDAPVRPAHCGSSRTEYSLSGSYVPPQTTREKTLAAIWEHLLGVTPIGIYDSFFELGGHSLLGIQLMRRIRESLEVSIPTKALFEAPTIAGLLARIGELPSCTPAGDYFVPITTSGHTAIVCVHPIGGSVSCYHKLAQSLHNDYSFYGIQAAELADANWDTTSQQSIERLADTYLQACPRQVRTQGFVLAGWSFGGAVAFEMARQLWERDGRSPLVVLLDTYCPGPELPLFSSGEALLWLMRELETPNTRNRVDASWFLNLAEPAQHEYALEWLQTAGALPKQTVISWLERTLAGFRARALMLRTYKPRPYAGTVALLRASDIDDDLIRRTPALLTYRRDASYGWSKYAQVAVQHIPGNHLSLLAPPHLMDLATAVRRAISQYDAPDSASRRASEDCEAR